jgi:uncharacterized damage-inducible protein DinB
MEIEKRIVEPAAGFSQQIGFYLSSFENARSATRRLIEDLSPPEIARRFLPNMHSIGAIAMHLGECEYWYLQSIAAEKEMTEEGKKLSHWLDTLEADFDRGYTAQYCLETLDKISQLTRKFLINLTDEDLEKTHPRHDLSQPVELSLRYILQLSIDHEAHHRGQISMIKRLLRES